MAKCVFQNLNDWRVDRIHDSFTVYLNDDDLCNVDEHYGLAVQFEYNL